MCQDHIQIKALERNLLKCSLSRLNTLKKRHLNQFLSLLNIQQNRYYLMFNLLKTYLSLQISRIQVALDNTQSYPTDLMFTFSSC